jgi:DNA topoisomerase-1
VPPSIIKLAKRLGLRCVSVEALTIERRRCRGGFSYVSAAGTIIRDAKTLQRLRSLAVPPAYDDVLYAEDPDAHLQAIGRDAANRLQYRYHPAWREVRELRKAARLARLAEAMPRIRRAVGQHLASDEPSRTFTLAAVIELVARGGLRPGEEGYVHLYKTRGAATLLKSNVTVQGDNIVLRFRSKGGKQVLKEFQAPRLCKAICILQELPGPRLFQYRTHGDDIRAASARDVNGFLREIARTRISLKDFRTLLASVSVLMTLAQQTPKASKRARRQQVLEAIRAAAKELTNTPAICAKSYVHETIVEAFEEGTLENFAATLRSSRSIARSEEVLGKLLAKAAR